MRTIKYSVLVLFSMLPFLMTHKVQSDIHLKTRQIQCLYENMIKTAVVDGCTALKIFNTHSFEYAHLKAINIKPEEGLQAFLNSLFYSFKTIGESEKEGVKAYIPVMVIIDYDGYYIYSMREYVDDNNNTCLKHQLSPKSYYQVVDDNGTIINLTLDDTVRIYDINQKVQYEGNYKDLRHLSPFLNTSKFMIEKKECMIAQIEESMSYHVNNHNRFSHHLGIIYEFTLPRIDKADWYNAIQDVGIIAVFQGKPISNNQYLNLFCYNGASILKSKTYVGYTSGKGIQYYVEADKMPNNTVVEKVFQSKKEAALQGYHPLQ